MRVKKKFTKYFKIQFFILLFKVFGVGGLGPEISIFMKIAGIRRRENNHFFTFRGINKIDEEKMIIFTIRTSYLDCKIDHK